jgi:hypothetical protein
VVYEDTVGISVKMKTARRLGFWLLVAIASTFVLPAALIALRVLAAGPDLICYLASGGDRLASPSDVVGTYRCAPTGSDRSTQTLVLRPNRTFKLVEALPNASPRTSTGTWQILRIEQETDVSIVGAPVGTKLDRPGAESFGEDFKLKWSGDAVVRLVTGEKDEFHYDRVR